jgi:hypothetical protein
VLDSRDQALLQDALRRLSSSLLQYVVESYPWISPDEQGALAELKRLAREQQAVGSRLAEYLRRQHVDLPVLGLYPSSFTTVNFVALEHLLPLLVEEERRSLTDLERNRASIADREARPQFDRLAELTQKHLKTLEGLAAGLHPGALAH